MKMRYFGAALTCAGSLCVPFAGTATASQVSQVAQVAQAAQMAQPKVAGPNILNNGTFSLPAKDDGAATVAAGGSVPGWAVGGIPVGDASGGIQVYPAAQGLQLPPGANEMVKMSYFARGSVTQTVKTTAGWTYLLQWYESGYPNYGPPEFKSIDWTKTVHVIWGGKLVAAPTFNAEANTDADMHWALRQEVVTATSSKTTLEFADATTQTSTGYASIIGNVSLSGDAKLYLPTSTTLAPTSTLIAVVHTATGYAFTAPGLTVQLYGTWKQKTLSYAPPTVVTKLVGSGAVVGGQAVLKLHFPPSAAGKTVAGVAVLSGSGFIPIRHDLTIKVS
ncbi:MAG: hypothetical protein ABSA91_18895 [Acidimicrobiales bacterium]|jgi:hypothetical protein